MKKKERALNLLDRVLVSLGKWLYRGVSAPSRWHYFAFGVPALSGFLVLTFMILPQYINESKQVSPDSFSLPMREDIWRIIYHDPTNGDVSNCEANKECPAHPENFNFWLNSGFRRDMNHPAPISQMKGDVYWLGAQIPPGKVNNLLEAGSDHFLVGYIYGSYDIWVNGKFLQKGDQRHARDPIVVKVPADILNSGKTLYFVVRVKNNLGEPFPDSLVYSGFGNEDQMRLHRRWVVFWSHVTPSMVFGINIALGVFFFAMWSFGVRRQEIAALSAFAILQALIQSGSTPIVWHNMGMQLWQKMNFVGSSYSVISILVLGLALGRVRSIWALMIPLLLLTVPWVVFGLDIKSTHLALWSQSLRTSMSTGAYFLSALLVLTQARYVADQIRFRDIDPSRIVKLNLSWGAFLVLGFIQLLGHRLQVDVQFFNSLVLVGLGAGIVHDFRRPDAQFHRGELTSFHSGEMKSLSAWVVVVHLQEVQRAPLQLVTAGQLQMTDITSQIHKSLIAGGAHIIEVGHGAVLFLLEASQKDRLVTLLNRVHEHTPADFATVIAVVSGKLQPNWQKIEGHMVPGWICLGEKNIFSQLHQLSQAGPSHKSRLVVDPATAQQFPGFSWIQMDAVAGPVCLALTENADDLRVKSRSN